jgi:hypothetical protein
MSMKLLNVKIVDIPFAGIVIALFFIAVKIGTKQMSKNVRFVIKETPTLQSLKLCKFLFFK